MKTGREAYARCKVDRVEGNVVYLTCPPLKKPCYCTAYHFPHAEKSGACKHGDMPAILRKSMPADSSCPF